MTLDDFFKQMDTIVKIDRCDFSIGWMNVGGSYVD